MVRGPTPQLMSTGAVAGLSATGCGHSGAGAIANTISSLRFCSRGVIGKLMNTEQLLDAAARTNAAMNASRRAVGTDVPDRGRSRRGCKNHHATE